MSKEEHEIAPELRFTKKTSPQNHQPTLQTITALPNHAKGQSTINNRNANRITVTEKTQGGNSPRVLLSPCHRHLRLGFIGNFTPTQSNAFPAQLQ
jgi:hypothetical protein